MTEKEEYLVKDLKDQEKLCIQKYEQFTNEARDPQLKNLFAKLREDEEQHFQSLADLLDDKTPEIGAKPDIGANYQPKTYYEGDFDEEDKRRDSYLCTDAITTEKYVAGAYNFDLFQFASPKVRELLNHIEAEEQGHAEKLYKYKVANGMVS